ncbi:MAG: ABC transporter ATP-binding protein [Myxococcota bacterium]
MDAAIRTQGLRKVYRTGFWMRPLVGLASLDLSVNPGEIFGFVGPNGAGKTTTMKIFCGLQQATAGQAWLFGRSVDDPESRRDLGFLPERPYFYSHLSARELLHFYGQLFDMPTGDRTKRIEMLLERVNMTRFADVPLGKYSKGMLQRVGLCQALIHDPQLVILDEPMSGLDPVGRALVRDIILEERAAGRTVFFSSHVLSDVQSLCDRVGIIVGGQLRGLGTVSELIGDHIRFVDCTFAGLPEGFALPGEERLAVGDKRRTRLAPEQVDAALSQVLQAGGRVLEVRPERLNLEEVLVDEIQQDKPVDHKRMGVLA